MDTISYAALHFAGCEATPTVHTAHDDGRYSVRLTPLLDAVAIYVTGTPDELNRFADQVAMAARRAQRIVEGIDTLEAVS